MTFNQKLLAAAENTYLKWVEAGCPSSYTMEGTSVSRDGKAIKQAYEDARNAVACEANTQRSFAVANFRNDN